MNLDKDLINSELLLLIYRFLENSPCKAAAAALKNEIQQGSLLPKRYSVDGSVVPLSPSDVSQRFSSFTPESLATIAELLIREENSKSNVKHTSLLSVLESSFGTQPYPLRNDISHNLPLPFLKSHGETHLFGRSISRKLWPSYRYQRALNSTRIFGHLAPVFCVIFDKHSRILFTGSDDHLIKAWQLSTGRLLMTLRGHLQEISELAISPDNTILASGSCDKTVRIWDLKTGANIFVLKGHSGAVTTLAFSPVYHADEDAHRPAHYFYYLATAGNDGVICLYRWRSCDQAFDKPIRFIEKSRAGLRILSLTFSEGGFYLIAGSSDCVVRVYKLSTTFEKIAELEGHSEPVDSLQFSNHGFSFATATNDGTARIFHFERQQWRQLIINCSQTLE